MSAQFKEIPADEWQKKHYADELREDRKADSRARRQASNFAAAFDALFHVAGFIAEARLPLHIFLSQTKGKAPDEEVIFSETEAGRLLGDEEARHDSMRKRWVSAWQMLESEVARTGKSLGNRIKGSRIPATRHAPEKKQAPVYFSEIAQAIVDIERAVSRMNGFKRDERFRRAALEVWSNLPAYVAPEEKQKIGAAQESRADRLAGRNTRRMTRFVNTAKEMIAEAQAQGTEALDALRNRLHAELEMLFADAESVTESDAPLFESDLQVSSENRKSDPSHVDSPVHVEPCQVSENNVESSPLPEPPARELELYLAGLPDELAELV